jgi:hypothetical protein
MNEARRKAMKRTRITIAVALGALVGLSPAWAQPFKCTGPDGKIVYSDTRCEGPAAKAPSELSSADVKQRTAALRELREIHAK